MVIAREKNKAASMAFLTNRKTILLTVTASLGLLVWNFYRCNKYLIATFSSTQKKTTLIHKHTNFTQLINTTTFSFQNYTSDAPKNANDKLLINTTRLSSSSLNNNVTVIINNNNNKELPKLDLVIMLRGEFGNILLQIAYGKIIQFFALENGYFNFTLRYASPGYPRSLKACREVQRCFSKHLSADKVNLEEKKLKGPEWEKELNIRSNVLKRFFPDWDGKSQSSGMLIISGQTFESIQSNLEQLKDVTIQIGQQEQEKVSLQYNLTLPFVAVEYSFPSLTQIDRYWDKLAELFTFNQTECCLQTPQNDETVLHYRGFNIETPKDYEQRGMRELDPVRTSNELLRHLTAGNKVAIISRFPQQKLGNFTAVLRKRGLRVRFVTGQSSVQDFCFLKSAKKEIIGGRKSTYFRVAALLNDVVENVTIYCYNYQQQSTCFNVSMITNTKLARKKWNFPIFH